VTAAQPVERGTEWRSGTTLTPVVWSRLLDALDAGTPPPAACLYAGISPSVWAREKQRIPEFGEVADKVERTGRLDRSGGVDLDAGWGLTQLGVLEPEIAATNHEGPALVADQSCVPSAASPECRPGGTQRAARQLARTLRSQAPPTFECATRCAEAVLQ